MVVIVLFIIVLIVGLFVINNASLKGIRSNPESILDDADSLSMQEFLVARKVPIMLITTGVFLLGLDIVMLVVVVGVYDLTHAAPAWEDWFAIAVMLVIPAIAIFLIIRGFLKLRILKKRYNS